MQLTILGGGGFRVPLVYGALLTDRHEHRVDEVVLYDTDPGRLHAIARVLQEMAAGFEAPPRVRTTLDLDDAVTGAEFVFSAIRVGGLQGRTCDERVALDFGVLGQETTGPGGLAYGLRTVPVARHIAGRIAELAPHAWVINFTNPAGLITQAMQQVLGERVVGICDSPIGLGRRAARALELDPDRTALDYVGLNHLGWLRGLRHDGRDVLPELLGDAALLEGIEEGRLFGADWIATIAALPNEYLYYYYFTREAIARIRGSAQTRGEFLLDQQEAFYAAVAADPDSALAIWRRTRAERDATYMKEARALDEARDAVDLEGGGYEGVALALMAAIARGERTAMILNVRNGAAVQGLPAEAVVEVPCAVDGAGPTPLATRPLEGHMLGLLQQVKHVEVLTIRAATERDARVAVEAFALHPLVDSVDTARVLLAGYRERIPQVDALFA
ncbi:MAG: 6-phospho-beta-glucosidase [Micrococcales bacterium]|nr:6-phospho-beta-glucosidase [Micrococcales bacterium]